MLRATAAGYRVTRSKVRMPASCSKPSIWLSKVCQAVDTGARPAQPDLLAQLQVLAQRVGGARHGFGGHLDQSSVCPGPPSRVFAVATPPKTRWVPSLRVRVSLDMACALSSTTAKRPHSNSLAARSCAIRRDCAHRRVLGTTRLICNCVSVTL